MVIIMLIMIIIQMRVWQWIGRAGGHNLASRARASQAYCSLHRGLKLLLSAQWAQTTAPSQGAQTTALCTLHMELRLLPLHWGLKLLRSLMLWQSALHRDRTLQDRKHPALVPHVTGL